MKQWQQQLQQHKLQLKLISANCMPKCVKGKTFPSPKAQKRTQSREPGQEKGFAEEMAIAALTNSDYFGLQRAEEKLLLVKVKRKIQKIK